MLKSVILKDEKIIQIIQQKELCKYNNEELEWKTMFNSRNREAKTFFKREIKEIENKKEKDEENGKEITDIGIYSFLQTSLQDDLISLPEKKQKQVAKLLEKLEKLVYEG